MAEGYLRHYAGGRLNAFSAGSHPQAEVHPCAVAVMQEDGVDISHQRPKHLQTFLDRSTMRYVIIVCSAADQSCPGIWAGMVQRLVWPFDDPAEFQGSPADTLNEFRRVRDEIKNQIRNWVATLPEIGG